MPTADIVVSGDDNKTKIIIDSSNCFISNEQE